MDERVERIKANLRESKLIDSSIEIGVNTPLVSSGLIDSFSLVELISVLEQVTGCRIPSGRIGPEDLDTIARMLSVVERWGEETSVRESERTPGRVTENVD